MSTAIVPDRVERLYDARVAVPRQPALSMSWRVAEVVRAGLVSLNVSHEAVFEAAGVDPTLDNDPDRRISHAQGVALLEGAAQASHEPRFGLHAARAYQPGATGFEYLVRHSPTLGVLLERTCRYFRLTVEAAAPELEEHDGMTSWCFRLRAGLPMPVVLGELILGVAVLFGQRAMGSAPLIELAHARPARLDAYREILRADVRFGARDYRLRFPSAALGVELPGVDRNLSRVLEAHMRDQLERTPAPDSALDRVRAELLRALPDGDVGVDQIAKRMGLGARTLRRRLADARTTFRELLDDVRKGVALRQLDDPAVSIEEVSFLLGFSEPSAFHRAFRRWAGVSPSAYRKRQLAARR